MTQSNQPVRQCVKCGHGEKFSDSGTRSCTRVIRAAQSANETSCGCKCEFAPAPAPHEALQGGELLPCPFCGKESSGGEFGPGPYLSRSQNSLFKSVICSGCCSIASGETESRVIERWNTRAAARSVPEQGWRPIESAPHGKRIIVTDDHEIAMAWWDVIDNQFYYTPQGGLLTWHPTRWQPLPAAPESEGMK